ncbi:MAG: glycosyltransferase [Verrucomicrobiota bacterium]
MIHPSDLALAIEHAEIARAAKDQPARMVRWQRVLELAGDAAPLAAFRNLADCHRQRGSFDLAESIVRRGLELHPGDFALMEKLADLLTASGSSSKALAAWRSLIDSHPDKGLSIAHLRMSGVFAEEGLMDRAMEALREGLGRFPDSVGLRTRLAELAYLQEKPSKPPASNEHATPHSVHLFLDRFEPHGQGTLCFPTGHSLFRQHVPAMLDFAKTVPPPDLPRRLPEVDIYAVWGTPSGQNPVIRELAAAEGKPLLCLESGFLSSPGIEGKDHPVHSVIVCPDHVYFDTTQATASENRLNSSEYSLTDDQKLRAEKVIASIVFHRLSKFNHAPRIDLRPRFPADGTRRILLIDQRKRGGSIHWSLGGPATFERMLETALAIPDREILVKLHPEVISGSQESHLLPLLPDPLPGNVTLIDFDVNPFDLFDVVGEVFVCTSQLGFEAAMAGKEVHCFASPFYAGWGFTHDRTAVPRRRHRRTITDVFHLFYIIHSRYFVPGHVGAEIEDLINHLITSASEPSPAPIVQEEPAASPIEHDPLRILMVIPSGRYGATGRYLQNLSVSLIQLGCQVMILAEGPCQTLESGVRWVTLEFDGLRLSGAIRKEIVRFSPHFVYENGVRSRSQRAALEAMMLTGARFAMQSEDDDVQVHQQRQGEKAAEHLVSLDKPQLTTAEITRFLRTHDWNHSLHIFLDPGFNRWIEPLLRIVCYRMASLHTAIWHPFAERLAREYAVPTLVVPPVASAADFERIPLTPQERATALLRHGIDPSRVVLFIGGALYNYSGEYATFLDAMSLAADRTNTRFALVVASGRSTLPLERMADERLSNAVSFTDLGVAGDEIYVEMLKACDVVCSPGLPDTFNRYRLPSRLIKAMAMAKPILTCRCGFGESLENGGSAFLMDGDDPSDWAAAIAMSGDAEIRSKVGIRGREFALEHFDVLRVASKLKHRFEQSLREPSHGVSRGIKFSSDNEVHPRPKIRLRNRHHSPLQPAIHALALRTHQLDTVVHLGSGKCDELEDYCRFGARQIALPEGLSEAIENFSGTIATMDLETAIPNASKNSGHLLVIAEENEPEEIFLKTSIEVLQRFRWIIARRGITAANTLETARFREVPLPVDHTGAGRHLLFEQIQPPSSIS